jgi:hypothetical protein
VARTQHNVFFMLGPFLEYEEVAAALESTLFINATPDAKLPANEAMFKPGFASLAGTSRIR